MITDLEKLIARVEAGKWEHDPHAAGQADDAKRMLGIYAGLDLAYWAYMGQWDAAASLHRQILPGYTYNIAPGFVHVFPAHNDGEQEAETGVHSNVPRAWLIAILKMKKKEQDNDRNS